MLVSTEDLIILSRTAVVASPRFLPGRARVPASVPNTDVAASIIRKTTRIFAMWDRAFESFISWARLATMDVTRMGMTVIWKRFRYMSPTMPQERAMSFS